MNILPSKDQPAKDIALLDSLVMDAAEAAHHLASIAFEANRRFYSLPPDRAVAVMNADVQRTLAVFAAQNALAAAVNPHLDAVVADDPDLAGRFRKRIPTEIGNSHITFDGTEFVYTPPVVGEPPAGEPQPGEL